MSDEPEAGFTRNVTIVNQRGLHARASAKFVRMAESFDAQVSVSRGDETVNATSIMGLMMLGAAAGTAITVTANGRQAETALDALCALIADKFGED
ncbi:MAG: HPr family phosphocarrier protein [PS1 clade bacterium]|uniref:HPr family phosphocarrier protein n=1 Tax=PS1 clade bacterium TaxID=2175152 RepID=A0A937HHQ8_9PROT|nr:HPr family phosphocarrier protein [PS1 clade bacterium]